MKILIIGGTGNISRWLTRSLGEGGADISLYNRGTQQLSFPGNVKYIKGDRTDYAAFKRQIHKEDMFDCVIDMVGFEPAEAVQVINIFNGKIGQYIFCSTIDVYSKQQLVYPVPAEQPLNASPRFEYAYKKMQMENIYRAAFENDKFPATVIRPAATYSEGYSPLLTSFGRQTYHIDRLQKGLPIIVHGDGSSIWVETHASDVAAAFANAVGNTKTLGKNYNVTGDELLSWRSMQTIVAKELQAPSPDFVYIPTVILEKLAPVESEWCAMNFQYNNIFDNSAAKAELGFEYTITYQQGVKRCLQHLFEHGLIEDCANHPFYDDVLQKWSNILCL